MSDELVRAGGRRIVGLLERAAEASRACEARGAWEEGETRELVAALEALPVAYRWRHRKTLAVARRYLDEFESSA